MHTMKFAYMLQSEKDPKKYLLEETDPCWCPASLASSESPDTAGRHFICESRKSRAQELADRWNERADKTNKDRVKPVRVLRGFVAVKKPPEKSFVTVPETLPNDLVWRHDMYRMLFDTGGTGADENTWEDGWDKAIETAIENLGKVKGAC